MPMTVPAARFSSLTYGADAEFEGPVALPDGEATLPGVLLLPAAFGITQSMRDRAAMASALGYVVLIADYFGGGRQMQSVDEAMSSAGALVSDGQLLRSRTTAALTALAGHPRVDPSRLAAIGFCLGGMAALDLALGGLPIAAAASFHGGLKLPGQYHALDTDPSVLICHGADDPLVPDEDLDAMRERLRGSGLDWQIQIFSNTRHAFTEPDADKLGNPAVAYNETSDRRAWSAMQALLALRLG